MIHKFHKIILGLIIVATGFASGQNLDSQQWICGYPFTNQPVVSVTRIGQLAKPTATSREFYVREDIRADHPNFIATPFVKYDSSRTEATFFIEESELDRIGESDAMNLIAELKSRMFGSTPGGLFHPEQGFYQNEIELFGDPPDVDGNGKIFILLMDIADDFDPETGGSYVAGYFDPLDQLPESNSNASTNHAEILYIDTNPGLSENFEQTITTAAHELQHLLHYGADPNEVVWINEGMSEVTAHLFGLQARSFSLFLSNPTRTLTEFDYEAEDVVNDYSKVALWTFYLYAQYGEDLLREIVRSPLHGIPGLNSVFTNSPDVLISFNEVFTNWVIANIGHNYLPDITSEYRYGQFSIPAAEPALTISSFPAIDRRGVIKNYAASYIRLIGGEITSAEIRPLVNLNVNATLVLSDGETFMLTSRQNVNGDAPSFSEYGTYGNAWLVLSAPTQAAEPISGPYSATFNGSGSRIVETLEYASDQSTFFYLNLAGAGVATEFILPHPETEVLQVDVNVINSDPMDLLIKNGLDGSTLDSTRIENPTNGLNSWQPVLGSGNPENLYVIVNSDTTSVGFNRETAFSGHSFLKPNNNSQFLAVSNFTLQGETEPLYGNWDIRLQISYPGQAGTDSGEVISVKPNPWIMSSAQHGNSIFLSLSFEVAGPATIDIFNILGQHVRQILNRNVSTTDAAQWDGTNKYGTRVSSGLYFIMVRKDNQQEVKKLTVIW